MKYKVEIHCQNGIDEIYVRAESTEEASNIAKQIHRNKCNCSYSICSVMGHHSIPDHLIQNNPKENQPKSILQVIDESLEEVIGYDEWGKSNKKSE